jgi:hypothetical protein
MSTWQFVDAISGSPTVRLDLNTLSGGLMLAGEPDLSPPNMRRVVASSMLIAGDRIPAAAFGNRTIRMNLQLIQSSADNAATKLQALARELMRPPLRPGDSSNTLRVMVGTTPMFFKTFPAPDMAHQLMMLNPQMGRTTIDIPCEPFGYGVKETQGPFTVTNDPAAASNGMFFDLTSPKGDVETPVDLQFANGSGFGATGRLYSALAIRRRGTPSGVPLVLQAEAMTVGTDTTVQANSALFSGSGSNWVRCTFTTATSGQRRVYTSTTFPTPSLDARGTYRVFARVRKTVAGDTITVRLQYGDVNATKLGPLKVLPLNTGIQYVDLGNMQIPVGYDPITDRAGAEIIPTGPYIDFYARRDAGSGSLDIDHLLFLPTDDRLEFIKWPTVQASATDTWMALGGAEPAAYCLNTSGQIRSTETIEIAGGPGLMINPNTTNRIFFARDVGTGTAAAGGGDSITATTVVTASYHPRYLYPLKPVST